MSKVASDGVWSPKVWWSALTPALESPRRASGPSWAIPVGPVSARSCRSANNRFPPFRLPFALRLRHPNDPRGCTTPHSAASRFASVSDNQSRYSSRPLRSGGQTTLGAGRSALDRVGGRARAWRTGPASAAPDYDAKAARMTRPPASLRRRQRSRNWRKRWHCC